MAVSKKKTSDMNASFEKNTSAKAPSREVIFDTITDMLSELLDMKKTVFFEDTMIFEELPLDSLQLYELVVDLEERFDIQISDEAIEKICSIGDVVDMIHDAAK